MNRLISPKEMRLKVIQAAREQAKTYRMSKRQTARFVALVLRKMGL